LDLPEEEQARIAAGDLTAESGRKLLAAQKPAPAKIDLSALLAQLHGAKVDATSRGGRTRIVIDVADDDAPFVLAQLGETAAAA
ncbi:MAG: hypothetical protein HIU86_14680, partial [Acidobacteria bacterium]|nr:hypothetical protein [Acidobacteriota bacterium]